MNEITTEEFDSILISILSEMNAGQLLDISGIYEILSEHFNNEVIKIWESQHESE